MSNEAKREDLVTDLLAVWNEASFADVPVAKKVVDSIAKIMEFVGHYTDFAGADKKMEALAILELLLEKTDSPGPDFVVDKAILWIADYAIDALYDAAKGKFNFDGGE